MSAEERLAALLAEAVSDYYGIKSDDSDDSPALIAARLIAAGVSVPAEPGAPDPRSALLQDARLADHDSIPDGPGFARGIRYALTRLPASQPVPAPEPSARLRDRLTEVPDPIVAAYAAGYADGYATGKALAATPQDPEP